MTEAKFVEAEIRAVARVDLRLTKDDALALAAELIAAARTANESFPAVLRVNAPFRRTTKARSRTASSHYGGFVEFCVR